MNITLRELERDDLAAINRWRNDPEVTALLGNNFLYIAEAVDAAWYENYLKHRDTQVRLAIVGEGRYIGNVQLTGIHPVNRSAEFSIFIGEKDCWGKGAGKEATQRMLAHGFDNLNLNRIWLGVLKENMRAVKLYKTLGFVEEGIEREAIYKNGRFCDLIKMAMLRAEYKA